MRDIAEHGTFRGLALIGAAVVVGFVAVRLAGGHSAMTSTFAIAFPPAMVFCAGCLWHMKRSDRSS